MPSVVQDSEEEGTSSPNPSGTELVERSLPCIGRDAP